MSDQYEQEFQFMTALVDAAKHGADMQDLTNAINGATRLLCKVPTGRARSKVILGPDGNPVIDTKFTVHDEHK